MNTAIQPAPSPRIADYMSPALRSIDIDATLKEAGGLLNRWRVGSLLVRNGSRYIGIVTDTDLSRKAVANGLDPSTTTVNTCMTKPLISLEQTERMTVAIELMKEHDIRHLVVTKANEVVGILTLSGVIRYYSDLVPVVHDLERLTDSASEVPSHRVEDCP
jgi:CBS domain-containing protein